MATKHLRMSQEVASEITKLVASRDSRSIYLRFMEHSHDGVRLNLDQMPASAIETVIGDFITFSSRQSVMEDMRQKFDRMAGRASTYLTTIPARDKVTMTDEQSKIFLRKKRMEVGILASAL